MIIIQRLKDQVLTSKSLSDSETFLSLIRMGEFLTKVITLAAIAALKDDRKRIQYRYLYNVVSADGIGSWSNALDQIIGTAVSINLRKEFTREKNELLKAQSNDDWGLKVIYDLYACRSIISGQPYEYNVKLKLKDWFKTFSELRNDYAHNRISLADYSLLIPHLERSLYTFVENFSLFKRVWLYVHKTLNGDLKFVPLSNALGDSSLLNDKASFDKEGVYVLLDNNSPVFMGLLVTDIRLNDFFLPNGRFTDKKFELVSYITSQTRSFASDDFLVPIEELPKSETHGLEELELIDTVFTNLPKINRTYISRVEIEDKLYETLIDQKKWRIVTLQGRGGIGKTSTALEVLKRIINTDRYDAILWFSARDVDFDEFGGPIVVQPRILTKDDISKEYVQLIEHPERNDRRFNSNEYFSKQLEENIFGKTLFVFDNFETVERPGQIYEWLEGFVILPNKVLITTRFRDFQADKPIEIEGMKFEEFRMLVIAVAKDLKIEKLVDDNAKHQLYRASQGHPYVVKILLGEIANTKSLSHINKVFENKDQILQALFERTYDRLRPLSQKIFQVLCNWRSVIPEMALEAIIICYSKEEDDMFEFDVKDAIDELKNFSFIEILNPKEEFKFINVPLTASFFGLTKLKANPNKALIQTYTKRLQDFGASQAMHIKDGIEPRIKYFFSTIKQKVNTLEEFNDLYLNIVQFICRRYSKAWLFLAEVYSALKTRDKVKKCYKEYLRAEINDEAKETYWNRLAGLYFADRKYDYYYQTLIDKYDYKGCALFKLTDLANEISTNIRDGKYLIERKDIRSEMLWRLITLIQENREFPKISATQIARLAWLYIHVGQAETASQLAIKGLALDKENISCVDIVKRLGKTR